MQPVTAVLFAAFIFAEYLSLIQIIFALIVFSEFFGTKSNNKLKFFFMNIECFLCM